MGRACVPTFILILFSLLSVGVAEEEGALAGIFETKHFDVKYHPGSRAGAAVERDSAHAERDFADICRKLEFTPDGRFQLCLYDDVADLQKRTGLAVGGFTSGRETHVPHGNDQTRYHELVHLVSGQLPHTGSEAKSRFLTEGLANALLEYVHGIPVRAVGKYYLDRAELPALGTLVGGDFYAWQKAHPKMNGYDIAGSYVRFLLDEYGMTKVKRHYTGTPAKKVFGVDLRALEKAWRADLDEYVLRPEVKLLLADRHGHPRPLPAEIVGKPEDWRSLIDAKLRPEQVGQWKRAEGKITATHPKGQATWSVCELGEEKFGDCAVRVRIRTRGIGAGVQVRLGKGACGMVVGNGTFIYRNDQPAAAPGAKRVPPVGEIEIVVVRRGTRMQVWVDGGKQVEADVDGSPQPVGIAVHTGTADFLKVEVRTLD
ncbi:MAG: hypothetical protein ABFS86_10785 [Planctomycetota bacterium]